MKDKIFTVVAKIMSISPEDVTMDSSPDTIEAWDSLKHMTLILALEEDFGILFSDDEIVEMITVQKILDFLETKGVK